MSFTGARVITLDHIGTLAAISGAWSSSEIIMQDPGGLNMAVPGPLEGGAAFYNSWIRGS